jgi:hypothetical protein
MRLGSRLAKGLLVVAPRSHFSTARTNARSSGNGRLSKVNSSVICALPSPQIGGQIENSFPNIPNKTTSFVASNLSRGRRNSDLNEGLICHRICQISFDTRTDFLR